jgi:hypothetical protein
MKSDLNNSSRLALLVSAAFLIQGGAAALASDAEDAQAIAGQLLAGRPAARSSRISVSAAMWTDHAPQSRLDAQDQARRFILGPRYQSNDIKQAGATRSEQTRLRQVVRPGKVLDGQALARRMLLGSTG